MIYFLSSVVNGEMFDDHIAAVLVKGLHVTHAKEEHKGGFAEFKRKAIVIRRAPQENLASSHPNRIDLCIRSRAEKKGMMDLERQREGRKRRKEREEGQRGTMSRGGT